MEEKLQKQIAERVSLVKNSLLSAIYQNRWYKVGIKQLINRLFILFQKPCVIVILQKLSDGNFKVIHHTLLDPLWKTTFEKPFLNGTIGKKQGDHVFIKPKIRNISAENYRFPILGDFYAMVINIGYNKNLPTSLEFKPIAVDDEQLRGLIDEINSFLTEKKSISEQLKNNFLEKGEEWIEGKIDIKKPPLQELKNITKLKKLKIIGKRYFDHHFKEIRSIFDEEYRRIFDSPLISENNRNPPNVFFFVKSFHHGKLRYRGKRFPNRAGSYSHGVKIVIPDTQKQHLKRALETLFNANEIRQKDQETFIFPIESIVQDGQGNYVYEHTNTQNEIPRFKGEDDFFWDKLGEPDGIDEILKEMESPFGLHARSISDSVLETGYVHVKEKPFIDGGAIRLEPEAWDQGQQSLDFRRLVYLHYVSHMMMTRGGKAMWTLLIPGHVGGNPWFCMSYFFNRNQNEHVTWLDNYHFYHSTYLYVVRGVRSQIRDLYLKKISDIYIYGQEIILNKIKKKTNFHSHEICDILNPQFEALTRIYPFARIEFVIGEKNSLENANLRPDFYHRYLESWGSRVEIAVFLRPNSFFIQRLNGLYLKANKVQSILKEADRELTQKS